MSILPEQMTVTANSGLGRPAARQGQFGSSHTQSQQSNIGKIVMRIGIAADHGDSI